MEFNFFFNLYIYSHEYLKQFKGLTIQHEKKGGACFSAKLSDDLHAHIMIIYCLLGIQTVKLNSSYTEQNFSRATLLIHCLTDMTEIRYFNTSGCGLAN